MRLSEYQFNILMDVLKHACNFHNKFAGYPTDDLLKILNEIRNQQDKTVREYSHDTLMYEDCEHDWGNTIYTSNPAQHKCIKCGHMEFVK